jgi:hypothetical protein
VYLWRRSPPTAKAKEIPENPLGVPQQMRAERRVEKGWVLLINKPEGQKKIFWARGVLQESAYRAVFKYGSLH